MDVVSERLRLCLSACSRPGGPGGGGGGGGGGPSPAASPGRRHGKKIVTSDPYVTVSVPQATIARTRVLKNAKNPKWDQRFRVALAHPVIHLEFRVKDDDVFGAEVIGIVKIPARDIAAGGVISGWFAVSGPAGEAGHRPRARPEIHACGEEPGLPLVREPTRPLPRGGDLTLGELLKYKSEEGVRVLLLIWDDKTSHDKYFIKTGGVMQTHDEETRKFFKHSSVNCVLAPRYASSKLGIIKQQVVGTMFTHHQKCVLVDTQAPGNYRKITAFIGGIDLCDGRYDTPEHRLFRDLDTVFKEDFHNPTFPAGMKAPRQPWHDLHCRIEGPAAYDVLINFEQRWRKATRWKEFSLFVKGKKHWHDDSLIKIGRISWILSPTSTDTYDSTTSLSKDDSSEQITKVPEDNPNLYVSKEDDSNNWHVQIFRSIDSGSVKGFPTKRKDIAEKQNLLVTKDLVVDRSIQTAYIQAIRSAQHFVYIENQYFLGSSYAWPSYVDAGADNLIPMELALKITSKIRANERFAVYIVIPMWPEGDPKSATVQEILFWQVEPDHANDVSSSCT
ncbi:hypothetical protein EUGRSUZ_I02303 [Eucalyptus grandis]|uniref:Uncharacterized protein n=2 Tax=Eucalyptus grandis TaxID=71139 RepID=A0ACC3JIN7_EUCGR|nr:hypothetical protein EUGRSUZ_I02303 [Eucalyptus grandis]